MKSLWSRFGIVAGLVVLAACGISSYVLVDAQMLRNDIEQARAQVQQSREYVANAMQTARDETLRGSIEAAGLSSTLDQLKTRLDGIQKRYDEIVAPILEADDTSQEDKARSTIYELTDEVQEVTREVEAIPARVSRISEVYDNAEAINTRVETLMTGAEQATAQFRTIAADAKRQFPDKAAEADQQLADMNTKLDEVRVAYNAAKEEYANIEADRQANLVAFDANSQLVIEGAGNLLTQAGQQSTRFGWLGRVYTKTLIDMKAEYDLTPRRQSWDEGQEYPSLHNHDYTSRPVTELTYGYFADLRVDPLATYSEGWFSSGLKLSGGVDQERWNDLNIDPKEQWPAGDNMAEYWIEKFEPSYFHKYKYVQGTKVTETDWEPVTPDYYAEHINHLGMDLEAKPYGEFPEDRLTQASPHGMAFVGDRRYGRWVSDGSGGRIWQWLAAYAFFSTVFGPSPYYYPYSTWNTWNTTYRGRNPYYGECGPNGQRCYGTYGTYVGRSTYYSSSSFGRSGGFNNPNPTVRGAGARSRGGGFGGSGK